MASVREVEEFYRRWFPTLRSFAALFLGSEHHGTVAAIHSFAEYMQIGLPYRAVEMPLPVWELAVESILKQRSISHPKQADLDSRISPFDRALLCLDSEERLVFLLHTVYGVSLTWIELITEWPAESVICLERLSRIHIRTLLNSPTFPHTKSLTPLSTDDELSAGADLA